MCTHPVEEPCNSSFNQAGFFRVTEIIRLEFPRGANIFKAGIPEGLIAVIPQPGLIFLRLAFLKGYYIWGWNSSGIQVFEAGILQQVQVFQAGIPQQDTPQEHLSSTGGCADIKWMAIHYNDHCKHHHHYNYNNHYHQHQHHDHLWLWSSSPLSQSFSLWNFELFNSITKK